ncbi:transporter substrate-binding protein [Ciceribacter azotifigens]|uniref:transporter substrate-binding protein n=1 Tax=Ciceribacter azotifigens TaxID=2069303 RepID=UPI003A84BB4A
MSKNVIEIGVLFSRSGPYAELGEQGFRGAMAGIEEVNRRDLPFALAPAVADPQGNADRYAILAYDLISGRSLQHIVGCTTSWSRKEVIPVMEKTQTLLWYPCVYEGFEANENVVYVGACANQHILLLLEHVLPSYGRKAFLLGSNYVWGWETCRLARDVVTRSGGTVLGERHVPIGDTDIDRIIEEIRRKRPDFILNSLIGPSSYAFLEAYHRLIAEDPSFANKPALSCNLCENEIARIAPAADGHLTCATYFEAMPGAGNRSFLAGLDEESRKDGVSALFAQAYSAVLLIAHGLAVSAGGPAMDVLEAVKVGAVETPLGTLRIDRGNNHIHARAHIAQATAEGRYRLVHEGTSTIAPDPFLTRANLQISSASPVPQSRLRIVK